MESFNRLERKSKGEPMKGDKFLVDEEARIKRESLGCESKLCKRNGSTS